MLHPRIKVRHIDKHEREAEVLRSLACGELWLWLCDDGLLVCGAADPAVPDLVGRHGEKHEGVETGLCFLRTATHLHQANRIQVSVCVGVCVL